LRTRAPTPTRVLLEPVLVYHLEHRQTCGHGDRIATERVEVNSAGECLCDLSSRRHRGEWNTVPDPLGHRDDVGNNTVVLEPPVVLAGAAEAGLNFVGNTEAAVFPDDRVRLAEIVGSPAGHSSDSLNRFGDEGRDPSRRRVAN
jgi:hypothetical protein